MQQGACNKAVYRASRQRGSPLGYTPVHMHVCVHVYTGVMSSVECNVFVVCI